MNSREPRLLNSKWNWTLTTYYCAKIKLNGFRFHVRIKQQWKETFSCICLSTNKSQIDNDCTKANKKKKTTILRAISFSTNKIIEINSPFRWFDSLRTQNSFSFLYLFPWPSSKYLLCGKEKRLYAFTNSINSMHAHCSLAQKHSNPSPKQKK